MKPDRRELLLGFFALLGSSASPLWGHAEQFNSYSQTQNEYFKLIYVEWLNIRKQQPTLKLYQVDFKSRKQVLARVTKDFNQLKIFEFRGLILSEFEAEVFAYIGKNID